MKHVAGSGARAGQWVNCTAKNSCRLGGTHISERELYATGAWLNETGDKKRLSQVTKEDVENFQKSTKGQEEEWAKKAERAARRAKGIKGPNQQVFAGEKNLLEISEAKKFVPNTAGNSTAKPRNTTVEGALAEANIALSNAKRAKEANKADVAPPLPPGTRYIEIPDVARFVNRGDTAALAKAIKQYNIPRETVVALASLRARMTNMAPHTSLYTNDVTGLSRQGSDIPEIKEFLRTGDESKLDDAVKNYGIGESYVDRLKEVRKRQEKKEEKEARKSSATGLRAAAQKMKDTSARLTNVTDNLSELTSENKSPKPASPGKTIYGALAEAKTVSERAARNRPLKPTAKRTESGYSDLESNRTDYPEFADKLKSVERNSSSPSLPESTVTPAEKIAETVGKFMDRFRK